MDSNDIELLKKELDFLKKQFLFRVEQLQNKIEALENSKESIFPEIYYKKLNFDSENSDKSEHFQPQNKSDIDEN